MKKKKGFTLIELLAVIVILAVIAVIAVPMVLNTIEKARKGAFEQTINGVVKAVDLYKAQIQMTDELSECRYFSFGSDVTEVTVRDGKTYYPLKELSIKGKLPTEGEIKVCRNELLIDASDGSYSGRYEDEKLNVTKGDLASSDLTTPIIDTFNITTTTDKIIVTVAAHSQSVGGIISNYYYKIDDGKYNKTTEPSYVFEKLKAGQEYTITIMVENKSGITTEESKKITTKSFGELTIDVEDSNEWTSSKNVTINGTTEEYKIEYKIRKYNEETKEIEESEFLEYTDSFTLDTMATNDYPILIIARYNDNGTYSNEKTYTVVNIDTTSPTNTKPVVNVSTTKPTSEASVVIRQDDSESGLDESTIEYGYSLDNIDYTWQASSELKKLKAGTKYYVKTRVTNNVGKTVESEATEYTPGEILTCSVSVPSGWATSKTVTITGTQTGVELQYQVGATDENGWNSIENEGTVKVEENTSVYCRLWDGTTAGGTGTGIVEGIDNEDPSIPTSTVRYGSSTGTVRENSDSWSSQDLWWGEFNSTDNEGSGIDHYEYSSGCTKTKTGDISTSGYTYQNGTNSTYCIRAVDKAENASEWSNPYYFKVDTSKPNVPTSTIRYGSSTGDVRQNSDSWSSETLWWGSFSSSDTGGSTIDHYEYSSGCTGTKSGDLSTSGYTYPHGTNATYCIRAVDKANNISSWSSPYYFKVDTTGPSNSAPTVTQSGTDARALIVSSNQADGESNINSSTLLYGYSTSANGTYTWQSSNTFGTLTAGTTYYFKTKIKNNAGTEIVSNYTTGKIAYTGIAAGTYSVGSTVRYAGVDWLVLKDNGANVTLITKSNIGTGAYSATSSIDYTSSKAKATVDNWFNNNSVLVNDKNVLALVADSSTGYYVRLPRSNELSTSIPNSSGTPFWTMSSVSSSQMIVALKNGVITYEKISGNYLSNKYIYTSGSSKSGHSSKEIGGNIPLAPYMTTLSVSAVGTLSVNNYFSSNTQDYALYARATVCDAEFGVTGWTVSKAGTYPLGDSTCKKYSNIYVYVQEDHGTVGYRPVITVKEK